MLTFRAINDYKGIRKGQAWDLVDANAEKEINEFYGIRVITHKEPAVVLERTVDGITSTIVISHNEFELNFEWLRGKNSCEFIDVLRKKCNEEIKKFEEERNQLNLYSMMNSNPFMKM